jgi:hypothetical protein
VTNYATETGKWGKRGNYALFDPGARERDASYIAFPRITDLPRYRRWSSDADWRIGILRECLAFEAEL